MGGSGESGDVEGQERMGDNSDPRLTGTGLDLYVEGIQVGLCRGLWNRIYSKKIASS